MSVPPAIAGGIAPGVPGPSNNQPAGQIQAVQNTAPPAPAPANSVDGVSAPVAPGQGPNSVGGAPQFQPISLEEGMAQFAQQAAGNGGAPTPMGPNGEQPAKAPKLLPADLAKLIATTFKDRKTSMAQFMADSFGLPRGIVDADEETLVRAWLKRNPKVDITQLRMDNVSEDDIVDQAYPLRRALVNIGHPTWAERVAFAEKMAALASDEKYTHLHEGQDEKKKSKRVIIPTDIEKHVVDDMMDYDESEEVEEDVPDNEDME